MKSECTILSAYPLSQTYINDLEILLGHSATQSTIAELRAGGSFAMLGKLLDIRSEKVILPLDDENGAAILPILKILSFFTRAKSVVLIDASQRTIKISRIRILLDMLKLGIASISCLFTAISCKWEVTRLLKLPKGSYFSQSSGKNQVLYLKTNLWFGVKAGGSIGHIAGVVNGLQRAGFSVCFASAERPVLVDDDVKFLQINVPETFGLPYELNNYRFQKGFFKTVISCLTSSNVSFIYQRLSAANYLGVTLSRFMNVPLIVEYNGSEVWIAKHWGRKMRFHSLATQAEESMLRHADLVVTISDVLREELISKGVNSKRIVCYPNCIDPRMFSPDRFSSEDIFSLRRRYGLSSAAIVIMFIGTFGQWHGAEVLAEAVAWLKKNRGEWVANNKVHFMIVGDGLNMPQVRSIIEDSLSSDICTLTGLVPQDQAANFLAAADLLVSPHVPNEDGSRFFGSPTKLFEYMAMGKGILASNLDQIGEILSPGLSIDRLPMDEPDAMASERSLLLKPGSVEELVKGIEFLVENPSWRDCLGRNARKVAMQKYTWDHHVQEILESYHHLLDRAE